MGGAKCARFPEAGSPLGGSDVSEFEEAVGPDRRTFLKRLVVGAAFAAPVVSSFTMSGVKSIFASTPRSTTMLGNSNTTIPPVATPNFPTEVGLCYTVPEKDPIDYPVTDFDGTVKIRLTGLAGALPPGTTICIYRANLTALNSVVPAGQTPVSGYSVVWNGLFGALPPDALSLLTLTVTDPSVVAGGPIFLLDKVTGTTPVAAGTATAGSWTVTFTDDPPFVVTKGTAATPATAVTKAADFTG